MPADPSIYNALMAPQKSALDYANQFEDQAFQREQRGTQRQMNALQLQQATQAQADDQAYRDAAKGFGTDTDANANTLLQRGLVKQAMQYRKDALDGTKTKGEIELNASKSKEQSATAAEKQFKLEQDRRLQHLQELVGVNDVPSALSWLDAAQASGELKPESVAAVKQQLQENPQILGDWKTKAIAGGYTLQQQRENEWKKREFDQKARNDLIGPDGQVNQPLLSARQQVAKSGASNVNVKVDAKLGEGVAKEVGPMMRESYESANGAQQQIGTADALIKAVDSGKVMAGPGANTRLFIAQIGQTLGVGGKDTAEQIANTRSAIQGLAQSTVAARASLKGQGQVSDYEGRLLQRAASGEIDSLTAPEIRQIAEVNKRLAQQTIKVHNSRVGKLQNDPTTAPLANFYESIPLPDVGHTDLGGGFKLKGQ